MDAGMGPSRGMFRGCWTWCGGSQPPPQMCGWDWWGSDSSQEGQLPVLPQSPGRLVSGRGGQWVLCQGILPPCSSLSTSLGRISEATNLGTRPQQALKPQSRSSDHPRPQPSREHVSCSGHMGRAWGNQGSLCGCKQPQGEGHILLPQDMLVGLGGAAGSQIPDAGVGTLLWATGKG